MILQDRLLWTVVRLKYVRKVDAFLGHRVISYPCMSPGGLLGSLEVSKPEDPGFKSRHVCMCVFFFFLPTCRAVKIISVPEFKVSGTRQYNRRAKGGLNEPNALSKSKMRAHRARISSS